MHGKILKKLLINKIRNLIKNPDNKFNEIFFE